MKFQTLDVIQYVKPLREGGSLPAIVQGDDLALYVLKFHGAGQGSKALIAELIGGELARALKLNVPELVFMNLDDSFSKSEGDEEIQDLLKFSVGLNLGLKFLTGAISYDPLVSFASPLDASKVVLLDSIITNIDRTAKNTNLLNWNGDLWLIDHGASLYFHHNWDNWESHLERTFPKVKDHVLLQKATKIEEAKGLMKSVLTPDLVSEIVENIPAVWLTDESISLSAEEMRMAYSQFINSKITNIDALAKEANDAR